jgi:LysR family glycine cleavage system transcriptional activator
VNSGNGRGRANLPPLNAVRVFEAAGRHLSFARAAEELRVTQAAVSQQVKLLESVLGVQLFKRGPGGLTLSERGKRFFVSINNAVQIVAEATEALRGADELQTLRISAQPNFATRWLVPRLHRFNHEHPDIALSVGAGGPVFDFADHEVDVAIRYGREFPSLRSHRLFHPDLLPVCSPATAGALRRPSDLRPHMLLRAKYLPEEWPLWLDRMGVSGIDPQAGPVFDSTLLACEAAKAGLGVALGQRPFVSDDLASGELVVPFESCVRPDAAWHLIYPPSAQAVPKVVAFRSWLLREVDACRTELGRDKVVV